MASLWKRPRSKFWYACFTAADGRQLKRSTKTTDRKKALKIAVEFESAAQSKKTRGQLWNVLKDLHQLFAEGRLNESTFSSYSTTWLKSKKATTAKTTFAAYKKTVSKFLEYLGDKASGPMHDLEKRDVSDFRDQMLGSFTRTTANHDLKIVKMIFRDALDDGVIPENPVNGVKSVRSVKENAGRRAFTSNEIKLILGEANTEWKGMILMGLYTGQRLKDVAQIKWVNIDLENKMIIFQSSKTQRNQRIPIAEPLLEYLITLKPQGESELAIFPKASHAIVSHSTGGTSTLSNQFYEIMAKAGLVPKRSKKATGKGHSGKRNQNQISFHALRHTTTSLLKNAGVAASVVQDLVGHESSAMSNHYTHVDDEAKIQALDKLPRY